jgi:hypothetical protein
MNTKRRHTPQEGEGVSTCKKAKNENKDDFSYETKIPGMTKMMKRKAAETELLGTIRKINNRKRIATRKHASQTSSVRAKTKAKTTKINKISPNRFKRPSVESTHVKHMEKLNDKATRDQSETARDAVIVYKTNYLRFQSRFSSVVLSLRQKYEKDQQRETENTELSRMEIEDNEEWKKHHKNDKGPESKEDNKKTLITSFFKETIGSCTNVATNWYTDFYHDRVLLATELMDIPDYREEEADKKTRNNLTNNEIHIKESNCQDLACDGELVFSAKDANAICTKCGICFRGSFSYKKSYSDIQTCNTRLPAPYERIAHVRLPVFYFYFFMCFVLLCKKHRDRKRHLHYFLVHSFFVLISSVPSFIVPRGGKFTALLTKDNCCPEVD